MAVVMLFVVTGHVALFRFAFPRTNLVFCLKPGRTPQTPAGPGHRKLPQNPSRATPQKPQQQHDVKKNRFFGGTSLTIFSVPAFLKVIAAVRFAGESALSPAVLSVTSPTPPHCRTTTPPHCRTTTPPHRASSFESLEMFESLGVHHTTACRTTAPSYCRTAAPSHCRTVALSHCRHVGHVAPHHRASDLSMLSRHSLVTQVHTMTTMGAIHPVCYCLCVYHICACGLWAWFEYRVAYPRAPSNNTGAPPN